MKLSLIHSTKYLLHEDIGGKILFETYDGKKVDHQVDIKVTKTLLK